MKYKGIELKEIAESHIENLPKKMLVWGTSDDEPSKRVVCATAIDNCGNLFFIARQNFKQCNGVVVWKHCAEIPEQVKPELATFCELIQWIAKGNGMLRHDPNGSICLSYLCCDLGRENEPVPPNYVVRKWDDTEWHEPTREYLGLEDK